MGVEIAAVTRGTGVFGTEVFKVNLTGVVRDTAFAMEKEFSTAVAAVAVAVIVVVVAAAAVGAGC